MGFALKMERNADIRASLGFGKQEVFEISQSRLNLFLDRLTLSRNIRRAKKLSHFYRGYIQPGARILDIGMGKGSNAVQVQEDYNADVIGIDVIDYNRSPVRLVLYDGRTIPFETSEFDVALVNGVFHHCDDPLRVFEEAVRVARRVIIMEDVYISKTHLQIIKLYDFLINFRHGVNTPFHFMRHMDWMNQFMKRGLKIVVVERYSGKPFYSPMRAMFYVLDK